MTVGAPTPALTTAQRRVTERIENPFLTSAEQAAAATQGDDFFLTACPGAGKTRTVGLRLAHRAAFHPEMSVAALSHTNTAVEAIRAAAGELVLLPDHYFVDTLHSFLLRYVIYPFGHVYMGCDEVPRVAGDIRDWPDDIGTRGPKSIPALRTHPADFHITENGQLRYTVPVEWRTLVTAEALVAELHDWVVEQKNAHWQRGLLSFSDVLWVAAQVLETTELAAPVAARFDELIIDEVQDAAALQLRCVELLRTQEARPRLVVVGDLCQAVYEWSGATPAGVRAFVRGQQLADRSLTGNYRSSQVICATTHRFSTRATPDRAVGHSASDTLVPELWRWRTNAPTDVVERFRERLKQLGVPESDAAILAWSNGLVRRLNGLKGQQANVGSWLLRVVGAAAAERDQRSGPTNDTFRSLDRAVSFIAYGAGRPRGLDAAQRDAIRTASADLLHQLPRVEGGLRDWNLTARDLLRAAATTLVSAPAKNVNNTMQDAAGLRGVDAHGYLATPPRPLARTIHDAKGESIAAVLVIARDDDAVLWSDRAWTQTPPAETDESARVAYVAFTRAEHFLALAIPKATGPAVLGRYLAAGFSDRG
jgi:DNA helicase II / ATP-dependent DNA helicase PcrA